MSKEDRDAKLDLLKEQVEEWTDKEIDRLTDEKKWLESIRDTVADGETAALSLKAEKIVQRTEFTASLIKIDSIDELS